MSRFYRRVRRMGNPRRRGARFFPFQKGMIQLTQKIQIIQELTEEFKRCSTALSAIGDETRQSIILALLEGTEGGQRVGEITENVNLSRPAVSHHLKVLKDAGIVSVRRTGTMNFYYLNPQKSTLVRIRSLMARVDELMQLSGRETR